MAVEKGDLSSLFRDVCDEFRMPITNVAGWADLHSRAAMLERMYGRWCEGQRPVLLYCGDHDPGGLHITEWLRENLRDMASAVAARVETEAAETEATDIEAMIDNLTIDRFGLNYEFIEEQGLTCIDNLETSKGADLADPSHRDHGKDYVKDYIVRFGERKCEANALVVRPQAGRELCRQAILKYLPEDAPQRYEERLKPHRDELAKRFKQRFRL